MNEHLFFNIMIYIQCWILVNLANFMLYSGMMLTGTQLTKSNNQLLFRGSSDVLAVERIININCLLKKTMMPKVGNGSKREIEIKKVIINK